MSKVAIVIGGRRSFGAGLVAALALAGCAPGSKVATVTGEVADDFSLVAEVAQVGLGVIPGLLGGPQLALATTALGLMQGAAQSVSQASATGDVQSAARTVTTGIGQLAKAFSGGTVPAWVNDLATLAPAIQLGAGLVLAGAAPSQQSTSQAREALRSFVAVKAHASAYDSWAKASHTDALKYDFLVPGLRARKVSYDDMFAAAIAYHSG